MTDTPLDTVNNLKRGHAQEVVTALQTVTALIESQPDLWFGGLPPILAQMVQQAEHYVNRLRADFDLAPAV
jgi:hypothetical protein